MSDPIHSPSSSIESQLSKHGHIILPALLLCDFGHLDNEVKKLETAGAKAVHLDVMDGVFVPQLTYGLVVVEAVRRAASVPIEVHMMVERPDDSAIQYAKAGADIVTLHVEGLHKTKETLTAIEAAGSQAHLAISPNTPVSRVEPFLDSCSGVLVMSVEPGFGGQAFQPLAIEKIRRLEEIRASKGYDFRIGVDGGISTKTISSVAQAGAELIVAGSAILKQANYADALRELETLARKSK